ncbi:Aste57867_8785 [Aphanomyces stellatus]|uniref:Aste57867_8785 protein n=1 Tax=Aphanomyces stellatus TaxID=120398 RepID=A0A485KLC8_9STRA|nr:hypothetical protein As57867_008751 [Aphanomyces stellatus]VFT85671.1 Aste57867_8785 [Aphanomyces stellatus]
MLGHTYLALAAVSAAAAPSVSSAEQENHIRDVLAALQENPWTATLLGQPISFLTHFMPPEYAVITLCFFTLTLSILLPYGLQLAFASSSVASESTDEFERAIRHARLDAISKRPNTYPPSCPVSTPQGDAKVQTFHRDRDMYTVELAATKKQIDVPAKQISSTRVQDLFIYPIKSCGGIRLTCATVLSPTRERGLQCDRQWLIVDSKNDFVTQRKHPKMALIHPRVDLDNPNSLTLTADGVAPLVVPVLTRGTERNVRVWKDRIDAIDQGDAAAKWIAAFLDEPTFRLVRFKDSYSRQCDPAFAPDHETGACFALGASLSTLSGFADGFPILIAATASLDVLQDKLQRPIDIARFRPNIVVTGCPAWADDTWGDFEIGGLRFRNVKPCSRCSMPSVDPAKGAKDDAALSNIQDVLKSERNGKDLGFLDKKEHNVFFGSNVVCDVLGPLSIGDEVKVLTMLA